MNPRPGSPANLKRKAPENLTDETTQPGIVQFESYMVTNWALTETVQHLNSCCFLF